MKQLPEKTMTLLKHWENQFNKALTHGNQLRIAFYKGRLLTAEHLLEELGYNHKFSTLWGK